jgi:hypothetical protein
MDVAFLQKNNISDAEVKYLQNRGIFTDYQNNFDMTTIKEIWKNMGPQANIDLLIC